MDSLAPYKNYLLILLVLVVAKFFWVPQWQQKTDLWLQLSTIEQNLSRVDHLLSRQDEIVQQREELATQLNKLEQQLQRTSDLVRYRLQQQQLVEQKAKAAGLSVEQMSWRDGIVQKDIHTQALDIRLQGELKSYVELLSLFNSEELRHFNVNRSSVNVRNQSVKSAGIVTADLSLQVLVQVEDDDVSE